MEVTGIHRLNFPQHKSPEKLMFHCQVTIKLPHSWRWHFNEMTCIHNIIDDLNRIPLKLFCKHEFDPTKQGVTSAVN